MSLVIPTLCGKVAFGFIARAIGPRTQNHEDRLDLLHSEVNVIVRTQTSEFADRHYCIASVRSRRQTDEPTRSCFNSAVGSQALNLSGVELGVVDNFLLRELHEFDRALARAKGIGVFRLKEPGRSQVFYRKRERGQGSSDIVHLQTANGAHVRACGKSRSSAAVVA